MGARAKVFVTLALAGACAVLALPSIAAGAARSGVTIHHAFGGAVVGEVFSQKPQRCAKHRKVKLFMLGGIRNGVDAYKAIAMGADGVGFGAAAEIAMGCRGCMSCHTGNCPYGITSQDPRFRERLDIEEVGQRLTNFIKATAEELKILTMLSGHDDIKDLSEEDLRAMDLDTAAITGLKLIGYERRLPWWENGTDR